MLRIVGASVLAAGWLLLAVGPANAKGCNGYVNVGQWGCAPWDNNNGPKFPHYRAPARPPQARVAPAHAPPHYQAPLPVATAPHNGSHLIGNNGSTLISPGNRNGTIGSSSAGVVGPAGGSLLSTNGGNATHR